MPILSALLFAVGANIDCLAIGISYGMRAIQIDFKNSMCIAIISCLGTTVSMSLGGYISSIFATSWLNKLGCVVIIATGIYLLFQYVQEHQHKRDIKHLEDYDKDHSGTINGKEVFALSIGLSANNAGVGIGASMAGTPILYSCALTFILSFLFIQLSVHVGNRIRTKHSADIATLCSSIVLIVLGIYELFI